MHFGCELYNELCSRLSRFSRVLPLLDQQSTLFGGGVSVGGGVMLTAVIVAADLIGASSVIGASGVIGGDGLLWKLTGLCDVAGGLSGVVYSNSDSVCVDSVVHVSSVFCCLWGDFLVLLKGIL